MKPGKSSYVMSLKGINVLVTGGNGAVGCNLVKRLLEQDAKVTVLDDFSQSGARNLAKHQNLVVVKGDITDKKSLSKVFSKKFDYVFHLAARFANATLTSLNAFSTSFDTSATSTGVETTCEVTIF